MTRVRTLGAVAALIAAVLLAPTVSLAQTTASPFTNAARYDAMRRVTGTISADPDGGGGNPFPAVRNNYDSAGRLIKMESGTLSAWQSDAVAPSAWSGFTVLRTLETSYDAMGRKTRVTLHEGAAGTVRTVIQYSYDNWGRLDCTAARMNPTIFGSLPASACTLGTEGSDGPDRITRNFYNAAGERVQLREGVGTADEGTEATWAYNLNGQVTTVIDGNGNRAELVYDGHGRQNCWMFPSTTRAAAYNDATQATALASAGALSGTIAGGHCASGDYEAYSYDPNGNRTNLRKRDTRNIAFAYDNLNRVTQKTYPQGGATPVFYSYDLRNLQLSARFDSQSGLGIANTYDGFGRLASSSTDMTGPTRTLAYQYDRNGNRTRITHPDGIWFDAGYDGLNRPSSLTANGTTGIAMTSYAAFGALASMSHAATTTFGYDGVQRPASMGHGFNGGAGAVAWTYGRNPAGQLNTTTRDNDAFAWTRHYAVNRLYTANGLNQYSAAGAATFSYDANGNLTSDGTRTYSYDIENRLVAVSGGVQLGYDPLGRLSWTTGSPNFTRFLYDGDALVAEYDYPGTTMTKRYAHWVGADVPLVSYEGASLENAAGRWLIADHQGSIIAAAHPTGATAWVNTYDEYGIPGAGNSGRFQYTGQIWLPELGMYHYKARVYSPTLGRFLQTDPIGYRDQFNLYAYVGNDPINHTDPTGTTCGDPTDTQRNGQPRGPQRCKIDGIGEIRVVNGKPRIFTRPATPDEQRRFGRQFAQFESRYTNAYNRLQSDRSRNVTIQPFRNGLGGFNTTSGDMADSMKNRPFYFVIGDRGFMRTAGGPGIDGTNGRTYVGLQGLRATEVDIVHEGGLHGTAQERLGGLQTPEYPLRHPDSDHQEPYQTGSCVGLGGDC